MTSTEDAMTPESFKGEVHRAFTAYVKCATELLQKPESLKDHLVHDTPRIAYIDPGWRLRSLVEKAEASEEFVGLASATERDSASALQLKNFFRRSRFYLRAFNREPPMPDSIFEHFWSARFRRTVKTMNLRLIHGIEYGLTFENQCVDCGFLRSKDLPRTN